MENKFENLSNDDLFLEKSNEINLIKQDNYNETNQHNIHISHNQINPIEVNITEKNKKELTSNEQSEISQQNLSLKLLLVNRAKKN